MMHDKVNIVNSVAAEIICRKLAGHQESLQSVHCKADLPKVRKAAVRRLDLVNFSAGISPSVQKQMADEAKIASKLAQYGADEK